MDVSDAKRLRSLEDANRKLKKLLVGSMMTSRAGQPSDSRTPPTIEPIGGCCPVKSRAELGLKARTAVYLASSA